MNQRSLNIESVVSEEVGGLMGRRFMSQTDLANAIGMKQPTLSKKLGGRAHWRLAELEAIAAYFDVPITRLFPPETDSGLPVPGSRCTPTTPIERIATVIRLDEYRLTRTDDPSPLIAA